MSRYMSALMRLGPLMYLPLKGISKHELEEEIRSSLNRGHYRVVAVR